MTDEENLKKGSKVTDTISTTGSGYGFVDTPEESPNIFIDTPDLDRALNGDTVEVEITGTGEKGRLAGKVINIVNRAKRRYVGVLTPGSNGWFLAPDDRRMYTSISIPGNPKGAERGYKAYVEIIEWKKGNSLPTGEILEVLGPKGDHEVEMNSIVLERGITAAFPENVDKEAQQIQQEHSIENASEERRDYRSVTTLTIDPDTAKDFDDALSFKKLEDGNYEIGVHIADVAHFVKPGSAIDEEAREREFSTYLVDRTLPMLPEILSNDLCSLNPNEDKFAFSAIFTITPEGTVTERWFGRTIIHSDHRYTYEEAQASIENGEGEHKEILQTLNDLAKKIRKKRFKNGAIEFHSEEVKFQLDDTGKPIGVSIKKQQDAHKLIEEFMLLANQEVALEVQRMRDERGRDLLFVYRIHDKPDRERIEELGVFLRALGYDFDIEDKELTGRLVNEIITQAEEKPEEGLVNTSMIRTMSKAEYSTQNIGHFGLGFQHYSHFTSPIRRYPDILVHRLLWKHLHEESISRQEYPWYEKTCQMASEKEIEVMQAERESIKYKQVEYLKEHIGEEFDAVITGVIDKGFFVEEMETKGNGFVPVRSLGDDYYQYDEKTYALVGQKNGTSYRLGDEIRVKLTRADLDERQLDFEVVK
ncbi:MAG: ribonuclease R [Candidatus Paceibacterota bacterium]